VGNPKDLFFSLNAKNKHQEIQINQEHLFFQPSLEFLEYQLDLGVQQLPNYL
jgi:hypothetical protein